MFYVGKKIIEIFSYNFTTKPDVVTSFIWHPKKFLWKDQIAFSKCCYWGYIPLQCNWPKYEHNIKKIVFWLMKSRS